PVFIIASVACFMSLSLPDDVPAYNARAYHLDDLFSVSLVIFRKLLAAEAQNRKRYERSQDKANGSRRDSAHGRKLAKIGEGAEFT
ncbi:MAG: hypothetical protein KGJ19_06025, partial [Betaproteobacteria bacterium]|nr:hypothetical protein [Betaproteobacteria bacterium]